MIMDVVALVKRNKWIYYIYFYVVSFLIKCIRCFVSTDDKLILFVSFGGRYFNDNPKVLYKAMLKDERFKGYNLVWAFLNPEKIDCDAPKIKINSFKYILTALKARCWITNVSVERGLNFKGKKTFYFFTTHTTLPKLSGYDNREQGNKLFTYKFDCSCAQSEKEQIMQESMFGLRRDQILLSGYPKNDLLCNIPEQKRICLREKLNLPVGVTVILYAPTYRDITFGAMKCPVDFKKWESVLGKDFVVLFRVHPVVSNATDIDSSSGFIYNVSSYPDNSELMIASDILISDYSGIFFEFAVTEKPMFCYAYDYEEYIKSRDLYFDIRKLIPGGMLSEDDLLEEIKKRDYSRYENQLKSFRNDYVSEYGRATGICLDKLVEELKK